MLIPGAPPRARNQGSIRMGFSRRTALRGFAATGLAAAFAEPARAQAMAWTEDPAFPTGPLAANSLADYFKAPAYPRRWPEEAPLLGPDGPQSLRARRGKTLLVALWAEWCAPCLAEMPALARLNRAHGGATFEIVPILTGSHTMKTQAEAQRRLSRLKGAEIETLADGSQTGQALMNILAQTKPLVDFHPPPGATVTTSTLPCLLVVDAAGRLRGRSIGFPVRSDGKTSWDTPAGENLIRLFADGALEPLQPARSAT